MTSVTDHPARAPRRWAWIGVVLLLVLFASLALAASPRKSASFDEQYHLAAGYSYLKTGDFRLATTHPPLIGLLAALPLLADPSIVLPLEHPTWEAGNRFDFSDHFLWYANADPVSMLERARLMIVMLGLGVVFAVFLWGRSLHGMGGALLAVTLAALDPNLLANSRQITTDLGVTLFLLLTLWRTWAWLERGRWWDLALIGLFAGAGMASKYNGAIVWPALLLIGVVHPLPAGRSRARAYAQRLIALGIAGVVALLTLWAVYRFRLGTASIGGLTLPVPAPFYWTHLWQTLTGLVDENALKPDFLLGQVSTGGWWYYFVVAAGVKTPLPTLVLLVAGLWAMVRSHEARRLVAVWSAPLLIGALALSGLLTIGYRHLLPALPFVCLLAGNSVRWFVGGTKRAAQIGVAVCIAWLAFSTIRFFPNHDSYFNELAGRWPHWSEILVDSNLDWGQDLPALRDVMKELGIERVNLAYFGKATPESYGVSYEPLPGYLRFMEGRELNAFNPIAPEPGWYAISATSLRLGALQPGQSEVYRYFADRTPDARAGYSINLYLVPDNPQVEERALLVTGQPATGLAPEALAGEGWRSQVRWRGSENTTIVPAPAPPVDDPSFIPVGADFAGVFTLDGYTVQGAEPRAGESVLLNLHWRKGPNQMPMPAPARGEPVSSFLHIVDGQPSQIVALFDGWDVALRGLREGDRIVQPVEVELPDNLDPGKSYRILVGLYSPQDGQRLHVTGGVSVSDTAELGVLNITE